MSAPSLRIAAVSLHTSPLEDPGGADAGGMNVVVLEQSLALARLGHRVDLFTRRSDPLAPDIIEITTGVRLHHLDAGPAAPLAKSAMEQAIAPFRTALHTVLTADDPAGGWDLVHSHHWFSGVAALPVARELGIPHLQSFHSVAAPEGAGSLDAGEPAESHGRIPGEQFAATGSDLVVAVSEAEARTVGERYGVPGSRLSVVRPGVDIERFCPCPDVEERRLGPTVLFTARLQPLKGPDLALEVLARLDPALGARLVLAGGTSEDFADYLEELRALADELGVGDRVEFVGSLGRDELAEAMRCAGALLLTSWSETFGLVALEAQASGTPVLAWRCAGGVQEAVGPEGLVLESRDPDVWAEALQSLLGDAGRYRTAVRSAREFAATRTWDAAAESLAGLYAAVIAHPAIQAPVPVPDPWRVLDEAATVLAVHAHPDDESLSTGPLLASLTSAGTRVVLVTATRGEEGEIVPGALDAEESRPLEEVREAEIAAAASTLGVAERHWLGTAPALSPGAAPRRYRDSGMRWVQEGLAGPSESAGPDSFSLRPLEDAVADLVALLEAVRPDAVIGYDDEGTYGHPDHVRAHHVAVTACARAGIPLVEIASVLPDGSGTGAGTGSGTGAGSGIRERDHPGTAEVVLRAVDSYRTQLTVVGEEPGGIAIRHVGGQDDVVRLRTGLHVRD
ncbi:glycosyltransferase [Brachybacterium vulturis]|uniref:glycosyltransferase n=1 Tax=Brachybacterium vulturis TaxID=2017484 RepID=UPI001FE730FC|nr:glycosyltransferase [Brachybacterium vulturis]